LGGSNWKPFFASAYDKRRKGSINNAIVTIKPNRPLNSRYYPDYPTLMLSSSVQTPTAVDMATEQSSSPLTNVIPFNDPFAPHIDANNAIHTNSNPKDKRRPIRSSSISDLSGNNRKSRGGSVKGDNKSPMTASRFYSKDRIVSNPFPRTTGAGRAGSPRLRRKRNFTESDTFHRPQTAPNTAHFYSQSPYSDAPFPQGLALPVDSLKSPDSSASYRVDNKPSPTSFPSGGTSPPIIRYSRNQRLSGATSDWASTLIGSDDTRVFTSADEDDQSDSVFDSFRTRISSGSHPGRRGPHIETIFNDLPHDDLKKGGPVSVDELGFENLRLSQFTPRSSISDVNSMSTPLALFDAKDVDATPTPPIRNTLKTSLHSSPLKLVDPDVRELAPTTNHHEILDEEDFDLDVSFDEASFEEDFTVTQSRHNRDVFTPSLTRKSSGIGTRASVFDWSERDPQAHEVRPSTVHGKQVIGPRSTRRATRKVPSAIHLRSQSVPVSRDGPTPSESRQPSAKFGTWGLGQKGVSEDWDGDFDFGDGDDDLEIGESTGSMHIMKVPQAIMETQASVHGQYGQVQELTLLVEELKRLRTQGNTLHLIHGASGELWKEAEGIVNLATFEDDENTWQAPGSPSSCGSFDDFDTSPSPPQKAWKYSNDNDMKRPPLTLWSDIDHNSKLSSTRDPSAKAKSVLETIYQQRESSDTQSIESPNQPQQKLPFDTQSLKELVTRASVVTRALKDVIRRAEGVTTTHEPAMPSDPPFSRIFAQSS
jgi:Septation protein etd1